MENDKKYVPKVTKPYYKMDVIFTAAVYFVNFVNREWIWFFLLAQTRCKR